MSNVINKIAIKNLITGDVDRYNINSVVHVTALPTLIEDVIYEVEAAPAQSATVVTPEATAAAMQTYFSASPQSDYLVIDTTTNVVTAKTDLYRVLIGTAADDKYPFTKITLEDNAIYFYYIKAGEERKVLCEESANLYFAWDTVEPTANYYLGNAELQEIISLEGGGGGGSELEYTIDGATNSHATIQNDVDHNKASGNYSHAEGQLTTASGVNSHAEGYGALARGDSSHVEGYGTKATNADAHAEGYGTTASGSDGHAEGNQTIASSTAAHAEGSFTTASGGSSHTEGENTKAMGTGAHAEGSETIAENNYDHAEGIQSIARGGYSHAEGSRTSAQGSYSHTEGERTVTTTNAAHAEGVETVANGTNGAHAEGKRTTASGSASHAEGNAVYSNGSATHAEGLKTSARGDHSHAEGNATSAVGVNSHAGGDNTIAKGKSQVAIGRYNKIQGDPTDYVDTDYAFMIGNGTTADRSNAFAVRWDGSFSQDDGKTSFLFTSNAAGTKGYYDENGAFNTFGSGGSSLKYTVDGADGTYATIQNGINNLITIDGNTYSGNKASGNFSHAEGISSTASGFAAHTEGHNITASGYAAHAEGDTNTASGDVSHAEGNANNATGRWSHVEGRMNRTAGDAAHSEGHSTVAQGMFAHTEGYQTTAYGAASHAEGSSTCAVGDYSHAEGNQNTCSSSYGHAEGAQNIILEECPRSHAEGYQTTVANSEAHAEGYGTCAAGPYSHAEGNDTLTVMDATHAEGYKTTASGYYGHAEGYETCAAGIYSHAEGRGTTAEGQGAHSQNFSTIAQGQNQTVIGKYNTPQGFPTSAAVTDYAFIIGNGTSTTATSNAFAVRWNGGLTQDNGATVFKFTKDGTGTRGYIDETNTFHAFSAGGVGAVESVNGQTGEVELTAIDVEAVPTSAVGAANGVAELDSSGKVPESQLPSYVDDVLEYATQSLFPTAGEAGKIYIAKDTNKTYRWSGTAYVVVADTIALGETSATAYRGDRGKIAYDHSQAEHARVDATKTEASTTNGNIKINGTETKVYRPTVTGRTLYL